MNAKKTKNLHKNLVETTKECESNKLKVEEIRRKLRNVHDMYDKLPVTRKHKAWFKI